MWCLATVTISPGQPKFHDLVTGRRLSVVNTLGTWWLTCHFFSFIYFCCCNNILFVLMKGNLTPFHNSEVLWLFSDWLREQQHLFTHHKVLTHGRTLKSTLISCHLTQISVERMCKECSQCQHVFNMRSNIRLIFLCHQCWHQLIIPSSISPQSLEPLLVIKIELRVWLNKCFFQLFPIRQK